jgi:hypothetical protein
MAGSNNGRVKARRELDTLNKKKKKKKKQKGDSGAFSTKKSAGGGLITPPLRFRLQISQGSLLHVCADMHGVGFSSRLW